MDLTLRSSGKRIVSTNSVLLFSSSSNLEISLDSIDIVITLEFIIDGSNLNDQTVNIKTEGNRLTFTCINFENPLGVGLSSPFKFGLINGQDAYLSFWVVKAGDNGTRLVTYTIFTRN